MLEKERLLNSMEVRLPRGHYSVLYTQEAHRRLPPGFTDLDEDRRAC
jgi:hypothetical protein